MGKYDKWQFGGHTLKDEHVAALAAGNSAPIRRQARKTGHAPVVVIYRSRGVKLITGAVEELIRWRYLERGQTEPIDPKAWTTSDTGREALAYIRRGAEW